MLGYRKNQWNNPGKNPLESVSYQEICMENEGIAGTDCDSMKAAVALGFTNEDSWSCWASHYENFTWDELELWGVAIHFQILGWTSDNWGTEIRRERPRTLRKNFKSLTAAEQAAAISVCYVPQLWDGEDLEEWADNPEYDAVRQRKLLRGGLSSTS